MRACGSVAFRRASAMLAVPRSGCAQSIGTVTAPQSTPGASAHGRQSIAGAADAGVAASKLPSTAAAAAAVTSRFDTPAIVSPSPYRPWLTGSRKSPNR
jgi:hypothetical protein